MPPPSEWAPSRSRFNNDGTWVALGAISLLALLPLARQRGSRAPDLDANWADILTRHWRELAASQGLTVAKAKEQFEPPSYAVLTTAPPSVQRVALAMLDSYKKAMPHEEALAHLLVADRMRAILWGWKKGPWVLADNFEKNIVAFHFLPDDNSWLVVSGDYLGEPVSESEAMKEAEKWHETHTGPSWG